MLKESIGNHFSIGTSLNKDQFTGKDEKAVKVLKENFNSITAENAMKWMHLQETEGRFTFETADRFVGLGRELGMFIVGHTLVWHNQTPEWVFEDDSGKPADRETLLHRMREHIVTVVGRYKGMVGGWDVVNEAVSADGTLRPSRWLDIIGVDYITKAFEFAHEADPGAELYYNDYSLVDPPKRDGVIRLVGDLLSQGVPIHGVGMQGHWALDFPVRSDYIEASIRGFSDCGVNVMITELDVDVLPYPGADRGADVSLRYDYQSSFDPYPETLPDEIRQRLADRYAGLFRIFKKMSDRIGRVTIWGISDGYSWLNNWPMRGRTNYPLLFDRDYKPKQAFYEVLRSMSA
ncbi:MAG: endo-1,4-beta-xylanase [Spirochaetales bacterium]|nr:endo-1,4-beta-xylanase [Spirochaetales bacterium]